MVWKRQAADEKLGALTVAVDPCSGVLRCQAAGSGPLSLSSLLRCGSSGWSSSLGLCCGVDAERLEAAGRQHIAVRGPLSLPAGFVTFGCHQCNKAGGLVGGETEAKSDDVKCSSRFIVLQIRWLTTDNLHSRSGSQSGGQSEVRYL